MDTCDSACHRNKKLKLLDTAMKDASRNRDKDPQAYDRARTAYYTYKDGQTWAHKDKQSKAEQAVEPILDSYQSRFDQMQKDIAKQQAKQQSTQDESNKEVGDEQEIRFVHSQIRKEMDSAKVYRRYQELAGAPMDVYSWLPSFLDLILGITILFIAYQLFVQGKFSAIVNTVSQSSG